eukprot:gene30241-34133_t
MQLHPDLESFLELVQMGDATPMHQQSPAEARRSYDAATPMLDAPGEPSVRTQDMHLPGADGRQIPARLYSPQGSGGPSAELPALLFFHGGGYCIGGLESHDALCRDLAHRTPCKAKMPMIVMNAVTTGITAKSPYMLRTSMTMHQMTGPFGTWTAKNKIGKVYTLVSDYSTGLDADHAFHAGDENLAIANLAGVGGLDDGVHAAVHVFGLHDHFHLHLGQKVHHVLGTAVELGVALLAAKAFHLRHRDTLNADGAEGFTDFIKLEGLDDGSHHLH